MKVDPIERLAARILIVRGQQVMLDADLAEVYGVGTNTFIQAVKRNLGRFPVDFAFQLNASETIDLRTQIATSSPQNVHRIHPWVFTDRGALMSAFVLNSRQAIHMSIHIVRASVRLREMVASDRSLAKMLDNLERLVLHCDEGTASILRAIRQLALLRKPNSKRNVRLI